MKQLETPRIIKSRFGPITATHELHEFNVHLRPDSEQIVSIKTLCAEVDGAIVPIDEVDIARETVIISGDKLKALGDDPKFSDVLAKHEEIMILTKDQRAAEAAAREQRIRDQIAAAEENLRNLRAQQA